MTTPTDSLAILTVRTTRGQPSVQEYVCLRSGEIFDAKAVQSRAVRPHAMRFRARKLDSLRKEPQEFARFILRYRNGRCGFLVPLDTLVKYYARMTRKEAKNVRRYIPALIDAGILVDGQSLHEDFMVSNPTETKATAKGDAFRASCKFAVEWLRRRISETEQTAHFLPGQIITYQ